MKLGVIVPVCDADEKHFARFYAELTRLGYPFAIYFDRCSAATKQYWLDHPLRCGFDAGTGSFDESYREYALRVLKRQGFEASLQMDVDETLEKLAPQKLEALCKRDDWDVVLARCLDLWDDDKHYRVDGPFGSATREKLHRLNRWDTRYTHPISHAPYFFQDGVRVDDKLVRVVKPGLHVLHWGIMNMEDAVIHRDRWHAIFMEKCHNIAYGSYNYYFDPANGPVRLADFDYDTFTGE